jgi:hypothetical protein
MVTGRIEAAWARLHAPGWLAEEQPAQPTPAGSRSAVQPSSSTAL